MGGLIQDHSAFSGFQLARWNAPGEEWEAEMHPMQYQILKCAMDYRNLKKTVRKVLWRDVLEYYQTLTKKAQRR